MALIMSLAIVHSIAGISHDRMANAAFGLVVLLAGSGLLLARKQRYRFAKRIRMVPKRVHSSRSYYISVYVAGPVSLIVVGIFVITAAVAGWA